MRYRTKQITVAILALSLTACTLSHLKFPDKFERRIERNLKVIAPMILNEYRTDTSLSVNKDYSFRIPKVQNTRLQKLLADLDIDRFSINYKIDTTGESKFESEIPGDIFNSTYYIDSNIEFLKDNRVAVFDKWQTSYSVTYLFGRNRPKITKAKDEFHNLIRPKNDSIFISRQNLSKSR